MSDFAALAEPLIRSIPDWPQPGVVFRDITGLLADRDGLAATVAELSSQSQAFGAVDVFVGIEARGFILAPPLAVARDAGFVAVRKVGKLPPPTHAHSYDLEYGSATVEIAQSAMASGARVVLVDDVLATGGTLAAAKALVDRLGAHVVGALVLAELPALAGRERLADLEVRSLLKF